MVKNKKLISIILLVLTLLNTMQGIVCAFQVDSAHIEDLGLCEQHLQFWDSKIGNWSYIITHLVGYRDNNGTLHYAYCLNMDKHGVGDEPNYTVNVTEIISNPKVWRAIINGFPYKTPAELGVANEQDAFVATKQAVYSVLIDRDVNTFYRGGDERGNQIHNAVINIVNSARTGTQTPENNALLNINKVGDFKADSNNYYSQEYKVSSSVEMSNYTITAINNFPDGSYIADTNNNAKTTFSSGEHFKVLVPKDKILDNFTGTISATGNVKTYPVFYGKSPNDAWQDYALTFDSFTTANGEATLSVDAYKSSIKVIKIDKDTKKAIEGVEFNFKYSDGQNIGDYKTNTNGEIVLNNLRQGKVIATETKTNSQYVLNSSEKEILLDYDVYKELTIENEHKTGNLKVYKVDADNNKITIGGVKFALYSYELDKITGYYTTDINGEIFIQGLRTGKWALIEQDSGKWYNLAEPVDIKVEWNETSNVTIENELKKSQVKVIKVDQENHEVKLKGVEFDVLDKDENVLETIKTNKDGEAVTSRYAVRDYPELYIKERITNEKYVLNDTVHKITLKENEIVTQTFENKKIRGQVEIVKTAETDNKITGAKAGDPIANVSFDIFDENKNYIETITTNEQGIAKTSLLEKGVKYIKEKGKIKYYLLNTDEYKAEIQKDGEVVKVNITNKPETPDVDIEKNGIIQTTANEEIRYDFKIKNTGNVPLNNFTWYDYLPTDYVRMTKLVTGTYNQDLNYSVYYKTNLNDYKLLKENLNTKTNNYIDFSNLELAEGEFVTEFKADFGTVDVGFESVISPYVFVTVNSTVKNDDTFTNKTRIEGINDGYLVWDEDNHTTKVYEKKINIKLPRTGC
ncbi:MAG: Cys-Gln thioester bond-forming surface protein [Clostridia bacterium]|nr:Cys-Gln thioester bond-forming surface protein [Clostridia bacterium]